MVKFLANLIRALGIILVAVIVVGRMIEGAQDFVVSLLGGVLLLIATGLIWWIGYGLGVIPDNENGLVFGGTFAFIIAACIFVPARQYISEEPGWEWIMPDPPPVGSCFPELRPIVVDPGGDLNRLPRLDDLVPC